MKDSESVRIGSIIDVPRMGRLVMERARAEVIGFVVGGKATKIRVQYVSDDVIELRDDLTNDNIELVKY